jgi:hypothetical protein
VIAAIFSFEIAFVIELIVPNIPAKSDGIAASSASIENPF